MFERYTKQARRVVFFARYEATKDGRETIGTEHLLLGMLREDKNLMRRLFSTETLRGISAALDTRPKGSLPTNDFARIPKLSEHTKKALFYASQEADSHATNARLIPGDLLIGILREPESFAAQLLTNHGAKIEEARQLVKKERRVPIIGTLMESLRRLLPKT